MASTKPTKIQSLCRLLLAVWPFTLLCGCKHDGFALEPPDRRNLVHMESGLYVHRETELRVNAARLESPPEDAVTGYVSKLDTSRFFPLGTGSTFINPSTYERHGDDLVWREATHVSKDDRKGRTALGAQVRWEKDGATTVYDVLEIFDFPPPNTSQIDNWSPWVKAGRTRGGSFGWHAEANKHGPETVPPPAYPFHMRFRLVLSQRMYP